MSLNPATHKLQAIPGVFLSVRKCSVGPKGYQEVYYYIVWHLLVFLVVLWGSHGGRLLPSSALAQPRQVASLVQYNPPPDSQPGHRVLPEPIRGLTVKSRPTLVALVPDHIGLTVHEQPELYWYLSQEVSYPIAVTLIDLQSPIPLLKERLNPPIRPGVQRIRLADYGVRLVPGVLYQWFVALVPDSMQRSEDILSGGTIERIAFPDELRATQQQTRSVPPRLYAAAGLWYDAIAAISERIAVAPHDPALRQQRAALLEQVGLLDAATYDRQQ